MRMKMKFVFLLGLVAASASLDLDSYSHTAVLDGQGKYIVHWRHQEKNNITFLLQVETLGYVGFGFSPTGTMAFSDIIIGGVVNGKPYLQDYFTDENSRDLQKDSQQNYNLEYAMENGTHTFLKFSRDLNTCDNNDKPITESTIRIIWAYHPEDIGPTGLKYHGSTRGRKSLRLLNPEKKYSTSMDTQSFSFTNQNVSVPYKDTTYWCQMFKMPRLGKKHHIIKVDPLIQKGHENLVHHILLYECARDVNEEVLEYGHECYHPNMPDDFVNCNTVLFAWAIGGEGFTYPPHVGFSIGMSTDPKYVLMEIHYDNPSYQQGLIDNSGIRMYYTPLIRRYDAGVLETGIWVSLYHMIPPGVPVFSSEGHCTMECLKEALTKEKPSGIHVFAVLLHAHLAGRAIRARHFRKGEEQQLLAYDNEFDFNFQEFQYLKEERTLLPGDHIITECQYNTSMRSTMTWGGLSTRDEMCLSFLQYYPRINLAKCESIPEIPGQLQFIGVKEIYKPITTWPFTIKSPKRYHNLSFTEAMDTFQWSERKGKIFNEHVKQLQMNVRCSKHESDEWDVHGMIVSPPHLQRTIKSEELTCVATSSACLTTNTFVCLIIITWNILLTARNSVFLL
ncbi:DBH-like monooxygenase protein 1 [Bombina bombina]|uniref:DBH-like monooxygenase protein 1 n=1 Tax=Bombina bombina TaxID=8345 RepID=UPI00235AC616|nr:DBH-like monooxygenase protein 1 [Bombina bombina]